MTIGLDDGTEIRAKAVLITAGIGKFSPRPLPAGDGWLGRGMEFFVPSFAPYAGKDVVIVGGGDSAFDWALHLEPIAASVTLVHRRDKFRAHQRTVQQVRATSVEILTKAQVTALNGAERQRRLESVDIEVDGETVTDTARPSWPRLASSPTSVPCSSGGSTSRSDTCSSTLRCAPTSSGCSLPGISRSTPGRCA